MAEFLFLMHADTRKPVSEDRWRKYIETLVSMGAMRAGSAVGNGRSFRGSGRPAKVSDDIVGYLKIEAETFDHAETMLAGNPVFEAGGTVEIRALPETP
ncbi:MAG: hypothetical protein AAF437_01175 [Pseudomonadota bacterium]